MTNRRISCRLGIEIDVAALVTASLAGLFGVADDRTALDIDYDRSESDEEVHALPRPARPQRARVAAPAP